MARELRTWDAPSKRVSGVQNANQTVDFWMARNAQDIRNKGLERGLKKAQRRYENMAQRVKGRNALVESKAKGLEQEAKGLNKQAKSVQQQNAAYERWVAQEQQRQQVAAKAFESQRNKAWEEYQRKLATQGRLNKEGQVPLHLQRKFKRTWDARWESTSASWQSSYEQRAQAVRSGSSAYQRNTATFQSNSAAYRRAAKKAEQLYERLERRKRQYDKARSRYEEEYWPV